MNIPRGEHRRGLARKSRCSYLATLLTCLNVVLCSSNGTHGWNLMRCSKGCVLREAGSVHESPSVSIAKNPPLSGGRADILKSLSTASTSYSPSFYTEKSVLRREPSALDLSLTFLFQLAEHDTPRSPPSSLLLHSRMKRKSNGGTLC